MNELDKQREIEWVVGLSDSMNETFLPLLFNESRFLVLCGGAGSGKSIFAGRKILERVTYEKGHRFLCCRKVAKTLRDSVFSQLVGQLAEYYEDVGYNVNRSDMRITFDNGNEIIFTGLDDVEKLKSIYNVTGIWIEEASELEESDFNQLDIRLRGKTKYYQQIILTFNPINTQHWLKKRFFDRTDERATTHKSTYKDNRFLNEDAIKTLESFKDVDEYYYEVYALGHWGTTGQSVFNNKTISEILERNVQPVSVGDFDINGPEAYFTEKPDGCIRIFKKPERGVPYVIGADTAGTGSDSFVAQVIDNRDGHQVAIMRRRGFDEAVFARELYELGKMYNDALIGVETNFSTYPVMELERLGYPKQYVREVTDTFTGNIKKAFGFRTDKMTRPVIISNLVALMREHPEIVVDVVTADEMLTFVRNSELRPEAEVGAHDDCVMALAIAEFIRPQQTMTAETFYKKSKWTEDMLEDYDRATPAERIKLKEMWGEPDR